MKPWFRHTALPALALALLGAGTVAIGLQRAERCAQRPVDVPVVAVPLRGDRAARERGRDLFTSRGRADCHGSDGAARLFVDAGGIRLAGPTAARWR